MARLAALFGILAVFWLVPILFGGPESALDRSVLTMLYAGEDSPFIWIPMAITHLGGWIVLTLLSSSAAVWLAMMRRTHDAFILLVAVWGARAAVELQKLWIDRARPGDQHLVEVQSASFPSGHAANSLVTYIVMAVVLFGTRTSVAIALMLSFVISLSRPVLGVHWPSDVIGGWAFGLCCAVVAISLRRRSDDGYHPPEVS